jgi:hypothetical protein
MALTYNHSVTRRSVAVSEFSDIMPPFHSCVNHLHLKFVSCPTQTWIISSKISGITKRIDE